MTPTATETMNVFDRRLLRRRRDRAAAGLRAHDFLFIEAAERLADRLDDVTRKFAFALDLGCHDGTLARVLKGRGGIETLVQCDLSPAMARAAAGNGAPTLAADEEALPFARGSFDLIVSVLGLHWVNDLPGALIQIRQALKPDGLFLGAFLGGATLTELRAALIEAELAEEGGASPRVAPFAGLREAGGLLQRAGFALPMADTDRIAVSYPDALALMRELRAMGESNILLARRRGFTRPATLARAAAIYAEKFADPDGRVPASFEIVTLTGWAPHPCQPQPLKPGSATTRLADALGAEEHPTGDKARPK